MAEEVCEHVCLHVSKFTGQLNNLREVDRLSMVTSRVELGR